MGNLSTIIDVFLLAFIVAGTYAGAKKGLIKSAVNLIGLLAVVILSYTFKTPVANFLIDKMPFFTFGGSIAGLTALNILIYNVISFIVIFIILYCVLNVILSLTGFIDTLLKFTVIWVIPSKIGGALIGFIEAWVYIFLVLFVISQFNFANFVVLDGKLSNIVLNYTPVLGTLLGDARDASIDIYNEVEKNVNGSKSKQELNLYILQVEINAGLITKEKATELIETDKLDVGDVLFGKGDDLWSNI